MHWRDVVALPAAGSLSPDCNNHTRSPIERRNSETIIAGQLIGEDRGPFHVGPGPPWKRRHVINHVYSARFHDFQAILKPFVLAGDRIGKHKVKTFGWLAPQELEAVFKHKRQAAVVAQELARHLLMRRIDVHTGKC